LDAGRVAHALTIVHTEASTGWGGQEIRILSEAAGLRRRGHDVSLLAAHGARIVDEAPRFDVPVTALPIGRKRPQGVRALVRELGKARPDIVNTHSSTDSWLAAIASRFIANDRVPVLVRTRHVSVPVPRDFATRWLYRKAMTRTVTTGQALAEQLVRDNGLDASRVDSVPTGIDAAHYARLDKALARAQLALPADVPLVGIAATLRSWKGHRYLVEAMRHLRHADSRLLIVGDGPQREALVRQVASRGLETRVVFAGQRDDVAPWLHASDVFALPSYANEGVPQALLQAMFASVPCVTTDAGAIPEIARDGDTATIVEKENAVALAAGIDALLADRTRAAAQAARALSFVSARYTLEAMLDRMEAVFRQALADRSHESAH